MKKILAAAAIAGTALAAAALPAGASTHPKPHHKFQVVVSINDGPTGVLKTSAPLHAGEKLTLIGVGTGTFTVTSVTPQGAQDRVTVSPALSPSFHDTTLDFRVVAGS
jgi:hypothetical protein